MSRRGFPPIVESWMYGDPGEIGDALMRRSERAASRPAQPQHLERDRYYTQARRAKIREAMRSKR